MKEAFIKFIMAVALVISNVTIMGYALKANDNITLIIFLVVLWGIVALLNFVIIILELYVKYLIKKSGGAK